MLKLINLLIVLVCLSGCAVTRTPVQNNHLGVEHFIDRNFSLNVRNSVNMGDSVIRVKDYYIEKIETNTLVVDRDATIFVNTIFGKAPPWYSFKKGQSLNIDSVVKYEDNLYFVYSEGTGRVQDIMFSTSGDFCEKGYVSGGMFTPFNLGCEPPNAMFERSNKVTVDVEKGYVNYEIIYNGISNNTLHLKYREFTPENFARVAFYQDLTYSLDSEIIRFKNIKMQIHSADNQAIEYTVTEY